MIAAIYARKRRATWLVCALLLAGCTTHGRVGALPPLADPGAAAEIVVIREWRFIGGAVNFFVALNGVTMYGISTNEHVVIMVPPGDHIVGVSVRVGYEATAAVRAEARQRYYFRVETGNVFYPGPLLQPIAAEVGQALMTKTTRIWP
jgi:hypothetical protein